MKVALVVGHSKTSQGASNSSYSMSEFMFNDRVAREIKEIFSEYNLMDEIIIVHRKNGLMQLPVEINSLEPHLVVSLHCNAFDTSVNGCEMLHYYKSKKGKDIARIFQNKVVQHLDNKDRGLKGVGSEDRGGYLLKYTYAPAIICEPFFIDNDDEYLNGTKLSEDKKTFALSHVYAECIDEALKYLRGEG